MLRELMNKYVPSLPANKDWRMLTEILGKVKKWGMNWILHNSHSSGILASQHCE